MLRSLNICLIAVGGILEVRQILCVAIRMITPAFATSRHAVLLLWLWIAKFCTWCSVSKGEGLVQAKFNTNRPRVWLLGDTDMANRTTYGSKRKETTTGDNFRVAVRVRPLICRETRSNATKVSIMPTLSKPRLLAIPSSKTPCCIQTIAPLVHKIGQYVVACIKCVLSVVVLN